MGFEFWVLRFEEHESINQKIPVNEFTGVAQNRESISSVGRSRNHTSGGAAAKTGVEIYDIVLVLRGCAA